MLSPREMNIDQLPDNAQTWVNQHLKFTHGAGLAMSPVNKKDTEGLPVFYIKNIPAVSNVGLKVDQPAHLFRRGARQLRGGRFGDAGVRLSQGRGQRLLRITRAPAACRSAGFFRRLLFSIFFRDINLLVTENIVDKSKIMIRRNISDRIAYIAPFLNLDRDPYSVILNGRMVWIVDCYTTSDHYPYSQRNADGINYIRNSVKVVVDAYTGDTDFYVSDPDDPIIKTWQRVFPAMFKPMSRDAAGFARAHPLSGRFFPDPGRHLSHLSHDRSAGLL